MFSEIIRSRFQLSEYSTVKDWKKASGCQLSLETLTAVINRGKEPALPAFIQMAYLLGMPPEEIAAACKASGDSVFWRLIAPSELSAEESEILDAIRALDSQKRRLVKELASTLSDR